MAMLPTLLLICACRSSATGPEASASLEIHPAVIRLVDGESLQLRAELRDEAGTQVPGIQVTWSTSDPTVATVSSSGMLSAVAKGSTDVTASVSGNGNAYGKAKKTRTVTVEESTSEVASVAIQPESVQLGPGERTTFTAQVRDAAGTLLSVNVSWIATGGSIDASGGYTAGQETGEFRAIATAPNGIADTARVSIAGEPASVEAGPDQTISLSSSATLDGVVSDATLVHRFWTKASGPGTVTFANDEFHSGWETGDFSEWRRHVDRGDYVTTSRARSGRFSWAAHADPTLPDPDNHAAKVLHWGSTDYPELYVSAWFYWPGDYLMAGKTGNFVNLLQFKQLEPTPSHDPTWIVGARRAETVSGDVELVVFDWQNVTGKSFYYNRVPLPKDRWIHVAVYSRLHHSSGTLIVWIDGVEKFAFDNVNTLGAVANTSYLMWGVGNYGEDAAEDETVFWDDVRAWRADQNDVLRTNARFSEPGTYVLRLTAGGQGRTESDELTITVH